MHILYMTMVANVHCLCGKFPIVDFSCTMLSSQGCFYLARTQQKRNANFNKEIKSFGCNSKHLKSQPSHLY